MIRCPLIIRNYGFIVEHSRFFRLIEGHPSFIAIRRAIPPSAENIAQTKFLIAMIQEAVGYFLYGSFLISRERRVNDAFLDIRLRLEFRKERNRRSEFTMGLDHFNIRDGGFGGRG